MVSVAGAMALVVKVAVAEPSSDDTNGTVA